MSRCSLLVACALLAGCPEGDLVIPTQTFGLTYPDDDGDGIMDHHEGAEADDADADGTPNHLDTDSDNDTIDDRVESGDDLIVTFPVDTDSDGSPDFIDLDSDGNCIQDGVEGTENLDFDDYPDFADLDDDGDTLLDAVEIGPYCRRPDSDRDGIEDWQDLDSDNDGVADLYESGTNPFDPEPRDTDQDGVPDYLDEDSDGDGFLDDDERGGNELFEPPVDTDNDGLYDIADTDSDNDGFSDGDEFYVYGTNPYDDDTDHDGFSDGSEIALGTDPRDADSVIEGIYVEVPERTDVVKTFEFVLTVEQGDIAFLLDTTCSMRDTLDAMAGEFGTLVTDISATIPDAQYGVATFDDYNFGSFGTGLDRPFILQQQVTSDTAQVQSVLDGIGLHDGSDLPESTAEALYQALSGNGYDQNCNGVFDAADDVRPFLSSAGDAFGGAVSGGQSTAWPGGGPNGGMGFRDYALPIVVYATDADVRTPASHSTPGGCAQDAGFVTVANASTALGAYLIGVSVGDDDGLADMQTLADLTGSFADVDGDGASDDRLVFVWNGSNAVFRNTIVDAIDQIVGSVSFAEVTLQVQGDTEGFVIDIEPDVYKPTGAVNGEEIEFSLTFRGADSASSQDELHALTLDIIGDGTVLLDTLDIYVLVPGSEL